MESVKVLRHFRLESDGHTLGNVADNGLPKQNDEPVVELPKIYHDVEKKAQAMRQISEKLFVDDADRIEFRSAQKWISECANQVSLPVNFCGGILIVRLCRRLLPTEYQTDEWASAVHSLAAAYDFAFLALGHADDEADLTHERDGVPTRWRTHKQTRAVDGINLLLAGITAAQDALNEWPEMPLSQQPRTERVVEELVRALREASFPILLDRSGLGYFHAASGEDGRTELQIDETSLSNVSLYARHRAHTYFLRALWIAVLTTGHETIDEEFEKTLERLFELLASIGAASDDLQDAFVDLSARTHSIVSVMAHLCVADDQYLRPQFRQKMDEAELGEQRKILSELWGAPLSEPNKEKAIELFKAVGLRKALYQHYEPQCIEFARSMYEAVKKYDFSVELMSEIVGYVCQDEEFSIPPQYITMLESLDDEAMVNLANIEIGKYIAGYFIERFLPRSS